MAGNRQPVTGAGYFASPRHAAAGIERTRVSLDPGIGIGIGKTHEHNDTLMASSRRFHDLGQPLLVGHSRKGFIGKLLADKEVPHLFGTF